jgi:hypothetical protein
MQRIPVLLLFLGIILTGLSRNATAAGPAPALISTVVSSGSYLNPLNNSAYQFQLLQLSEPGGRTTYAIWFPPKSSAGPRPALLITEQYDGVTWSSASVDQSWLARYNPAQSDFPDVNGPFYSSKSGPISYYPWTMDQIPPTGGTCLIHNVGVLFTFARFYAGGSIADNVVDTTLGLQFLKQQSGVDLNHLGVFGFSWGGFEAIYGAANAPAGAVPAIGVAWSTPSDMEQTFQYISTGLPSLIQDPNVLAQRQLFYDPYYRRIIAGTVTSFSPLTLDFSSYNLNFLQANLKTKFLVFHDTWDTIVPFGQSVALVHALPSIVQGLWFPHAGPINYNTLPLSHTPVQSELESSNAYVFTSVYLLERLLPANAQILIPYSSSDLIAYLENMRSLQKQGVDISTLLPRLSDLMDPRIVMVDESPAPGNLPPKPGVYWVNYFLNLP